MNEQTNVVDFPKLTRQRISIEKLRGRYGFFTIEDDTLVSWPDLVLQVMGQVVVLKAERCQRGATVYFAISEQFAAIPHGELAPEYEWVYERGAMRARRLTAADA